MYLYAKVFWTSEISLLSVSKIYWLLPYQPQVLQYVEEGHFYPGEQVFQVVPKNKEFINIISFTVLLPNKKF